MAAKPAELASSFEAIGSHDAPPTGEPVVRRTARWLVGQTPIWIGIVDLALILGFGLASIDHVFLSAASFRNIAADLAEPLLLAGCMALLLGAGEFDLSLGANIVLSSVVGGKVIASLLAGGSGVGPSIAIGAVAALATGAVVGAVNAFLVVRLRVTSLIATLAVAGMTIGTAELMTSGSDLAGIPEPLQADFGTRIVLGVVPVVALVALAVFAGQWLMVAKTRVGLRILATGSSTDAAVKAGLRVGRLRTGLFVMAGLVAGLAATFDLGRFAGTNIAGHQSDSLAALSAAIIGGTSLRGGRTKMAGVFAGALLAVLLQDGLVVIGLSSFYQQIAVGATLAIAVALDEWRKRKRETEGT